RSHSSDLPASFVLAFRRSCHGNSAALPVWEKLNTPVGVNSLAGHRRSSIPVWPSLEWVAQRKCPFWQSAGNVQVVATRDGRIRYSTRRVPAGWKLRFSGVECYLEQKDR